MIIYAKKPTLRSKRELEHHKDGLSPKLKAGDGDVFAVSCPSVKQSMRIFLISETFL